MAVPQIRSDESIGRPEDIGTLIPEQPPRPPKPIRFTLDLDQAAHVFLKTFAAQHGTNAAEVMRALLGELADGGPNLTMRVTSRIHTAKK
jgi:hypothetical protein